MGGVRPLTEMGCNPNLSGREQIEKRLENCRRNGYENEAAVYELLLKSPWSNDVLIIQMLDFLWEYYSPENWLDEIDDVDTAYSERLIEINRFSHFLEPGYEKSLAEFLDDAQNWFSCVLQSDVEALPTPDEIKARLPWIHKNSSSVLGV